MVSTTSDDASAHTAASPDASTTPVSEEQRATLPDGLDLCYQTIGDPSGRPLLLVMGLGGPMTWWPLRLCQRLADDGFHVIRYDNRDTGRSTRFDDHGVGLHQVLRAFVRGPVSAPYSMGDLASDAVGLLDHLGLRQAHVAGVSMGGMIAQTLALQAPDRVRSLTSISSHVGARTSGYQHPTLLPGLLRRPARSREDYVNGSVYYNRYIASPDYPTPEEEVRERAETTWDRGISAAGAMRQMLAILTQQNRSAALRELRMPASVVHGLADRLVHVSGGRATAGALPGAELTLVKGMNHDLPPGLYETFTAAIRRAADRADEA